MIVPDLNLLLYAHFDCYPQHPRAAAWWADLLNGVDDVGIPPAVAFGFVRLATSARLYSAPMTVDSALSAVESWLDRRVVQLLIPEPRYIEIAFGLLRQVGAAASLTTDAQIAAFAIQNDAVVHTNDTDFGRFEMVRCVNPLAGT